MYVGPINIRAIPDDCITFTDDCLKYSYTCLIYHKFEAFQKFKEFQAEAKKQLGKSIKNLQFDQGGEHLSKEFLGHLTEMV